MVGDDNGDDFPSSEPKTDSRSALARKNRAWRRLLSALWERGSPDLPACGPRRGYASRPVRPIFINETFKTLARDQASRGGRRKTSSGAASPGCLARSGEIKASGTSRGSCDVSHDDRDQVGARRVPARTVSLFPLRCKGSEHRRDHQAKASILVQQHQDQPNGRKEVIVEPK